MKASTDDLVALKKRAFCNHLDRDTPEEFKKKKWDDNLHTMVDTIYNYINKRCNNSLRGDIGARAFELETFIKTSRDKARGEDEMRLSDIPEFGKEESVLIFEATRDPHFDKACGGDKKHSHGKLLARLTELLFGRSIVKYNSKSVKWNVDIANLELIGDIMHHIKHHITPTPTSRGTPMFLKPNPDEEEDSQDSAP
jgi:hypothetical protein